MKAFWIRARARARRNNYFPTAVLNLSAELFLLPCFLFFSPSCPLCESSPRCITAAVQCVDREFSSHRSLARSCHAARVVNEYSLPLLVQLKRKEREREREKGRREKKCVARAGAKIISAKAGRERVSDKCCRLLRENDRVCIQFAEFFSGISRAQQSYVREVGSSKDSVARACAWRSIFRDRSYLGMKLN
jgi:hypothetical protein